MISMKYEAFHREPTRKVACPHCSGLIEFYYYSGMGDLAPHFYCDTCSNILFREKDRQRIRGQEISEDLLQEFTEDLPECTCGGQFRPETNPKCPHCKREIKHQDNAIKRLRDPYAIQVKGACLLKPIKNNQEQS